MTMNCPPESSALFWKKTTATTEHIHHPESIDPENVCMPIEFFWQWRGPSTNNGICLNMKLETWYFAKHKSIEIFSPSGQVPSCRCFAGDSALQWIELCLETLREPNWFLGENSSTKFNRIQAQGNQYWSMHWGGSYFGVPTGWVQCWNMSAVFLHNRLYTPHKQQLASTERLGPKKEKLIFLSVSGKELR